MSLFVRLSVCSQTVTSTRSENSVVTRKLLLYPMFVYMSKVVMSMVVVSKVAISMVVVSKVAISKVVILEIDCSAIPIRCVLYLCTAGF